MTTTVQKQVLINARALVADPAHWTRRTFARTADGHAIAWYDHSATKWCATGAIYRAAYDLVGDPNEAVRIGHLVVKSVSPGRWLPVASINDVLGHAAVLAAFDKALEAA